MRRSHANPLPDADFGPLEDHVPSSRTKRKNAVEALQELGERLVALPADQLKRTPLPENLRDAVLDARRFTKHEAIRRQQQYIGKLMRDIDPAPIEAALQVFAGASAAETARMHRIERERDALIENEDTITEIVRRHPGADVQRLRQLRRNAIKERTDNKPRKSYREIFQVLKELEGGGAGTPASDRDAADTDTPGANADE
jgi:ribosome-associated protein